MSTWIILTVVLVSLALPAFLIVTACMNSSQLSRAEEAVQLDPTRRFVRQDRIVISQQHNWEIPGETEPVGLPLRFGKG